MKDDRLVSLNAAIDKAIKIPVASIVTENKVIWRKAVFVEDIEKLPPAQPDIPDMNVIIDAIKNAINASTGNEAYMVGVRNGMRWCWSALTDKEPEFEDIPSAQPTLYGYDIKHLAFVASIMAKKGVSPEEAVTIFRDVNRVIEMVIEDMKEMQEDTLKKLYAVCPAGSADMMGDDNDNN